MINFIVVHGNTHPYEPISVNVDSIVYFRDNHIQSIGTVVVCKEYYSEIKALIEEKQNNVV